MDDTSYLDSEHRQLEMPSFAHLRDAHSDHHIQDAHAATLSLARSSPSLHTTSEVVAFSSAQLVLRFQYACKNPPLLLRCGGELGVLSELIALLDITTRCAHHLNCQNLSESLLVVPSDLDCFSVRPLRFSLPALPCSFG